MKNIIKNIAVLATAALMVATASAQNYSPASLGTHTAVAVDANHVQISPPSYRLLQGFNGDITNAVSTTGTNFVVSPIAPVQLINAAAAVNFLYATNKASGTAWNTKIVVQANLADRLVTYPATWNWLTNSAEALNGTNTIVIGKLSTVSSNTFAIYDLTVVGTNVFVKGSTYRP